MLLRKTVQQFTEYTDVTKNINPNWTPQYVLKKDSKKYCTNIKILRGLIRKNENYDFDIK